MMGIKLKSKNSNNICSKCEEESNDLDYDWPCEDLICNKCSQISLTGNYSNNDKLINYVWYDSIEHKGIEWYRKARDKLIIKQEKENKIQKKKELKRKNKLSKYIDNL